MSSHSRSARRRSSGTTPTITITPSRRSSSGVKGASSSTGKQKKATPPSTASSPSSRADSPRTTAPTTPTNDSAGEAEMPAVDDKVVDWSSSSEPEEDDNEGEGLSEADMTLQICREISFGLTETAQVESAAALVRLILGTTDDSRATAVELLHDGRRHPTRELKWPNMSRLVESALCVHIDVPILSQHDLSIAAKDGLSAVGLGDLHLVSDCPIIISDGCAVMFDPAGLLGAHLYIAPGWHGRIIQLDDPTHSVPGMSEQSACSDVLNTLAGIFGLGVAANGGRSKSLQTHGPGTQMRLPLRTNSEAKESIISGVEAASPGFVATLLKTVEDFSEAAIVFGRSLESVSWSEGRSSAGAPAGSRSVPKPDGDGLGTAARGTMPAAGKAHVHTVRHATVEMFSARMINVTHGLRQQRSAPTRIPEFLTHRGPTYYRQHLSIATLMNGRTKTNEWEVVQALASASVIETQIPNLLERDQWQLLPDLPWGGVAALVTGGGGPLGPPRLPKGRAKGFATSFGRPLMATGLPLLVNGTFACLELDGQLTWPSPAADDAESRAAKAKAKAARAKASASEAVSDDDDGGENAPRDAGRGSSPHGAMYTSNHAASAGSSLILAEKQRAKDARHDSEEAHLAEDWNRMLMDDVVSMCYAELLTEFTSRMAPGAPSATSYATLFPRISACKKKGGGGVPWQTFVSSVWRRLFAMPVAVAFSAAPAWVTAHRTHDRNRTPYEQAQRRVQRLREKTAKARRNEAAPASLVWACPKDVYFHMNTSKEDEHLARLLGDTGFPISLCVKGDAFTEALDTSQQVLNVTSFEPTWLTPTLCREQVTGAPPVQLLQSLANKGDGVRRMLRFATSDVVDPKQLIGLVVPLQDGGLQRIEACTAEAAHAAYWPATATGCMLSAHGAGHRVVHVDCAIDDYLQTLFLTSEVASALNIQPLSLEAVRHVIIPRSLTLDWLAATGIKRSNPNPAEHELVVAIDDGGKHNFWTCETCGFESNSNANLTCQTCQSLASNPLDVMAAYSSSNTHKTPIPPSPPGPRGAWSSISSISTITLGGLYGSPAASASARPAPAPAVSHSGGGGGGGGSGGSKRGILRGQPDVTALEWLTLFWEDMGARGESGESSWDDIMHTFEDVALFPGENGVAYPLGSPITPIIWLDSVRPPLKKLLIKLGGCRPNKGIPVPIPVLEKCTNPPNGPGCLAVVSSCVLQDERAETTFKEAVRAERHALLRMLGSMDRYTPAQLLLIATLPIVEVWDAGVMRPAPLDQTGIGAKGHNCDVCPPLHMANDIGSRSFISVNSAVDRGEIFYTDNGTGVALIKGRKARSLVLTRNNPNDQFNAGVVALLQASAHAALTTHSKVAAFSDNPAAIANNLTGGPTVRTASWSTKYRTQCYRDDRTETGQRHMAKGDRQPSAKRSYSKPWLNGAKGFEATLRPQTAPAGTRRSSAGHHSEWLSRSRAEAVRTGELKATVPSGNLFDSMAKLPFVPMSLAPSPPKKTGRGSGPGDGGGGGGARTNRAKSAPAKRRSSDSSSRRGSSGSAGSTSTTGSRRSSRQGSAGANRRPKSKQIKPT